MVEKKEQLVYIFNTYYKNRGFYSIFKNNWNNFPKLINVWYGISTCWVEFCSKINKGAPRVLDRVEYF